MTSFEFPKSIKSRPVYGKLEPRAGLSHLCIADDEGALAIIDLYKATTEMIGKTEIIFIHKASGDKFITPLKALGCRLYTGPSFEAASLRIRHDLKTAHMGMQLYLSGTESLIGLAMREAGLVGFPVGAIQTEHRGSIARRMQCVHCKGFTEDVAIDPFECSHCGLMLFVRDHYSKRHAAFQGVCIDAETPGQIPKAKRLYT